MEPGVTHISDLLETRHPEVVKTLRKHLRAKLRVIPGARDIWCRDFMPVAASDGSLVQFRYWPDYLRRYPTLRTPDGARLLKLPNCIRSNLILDGGNVVRLGDIAILTSKIFRENPHHTQPTLRAKLQELLKLDHLITIPPEPGDIFGHSDGVLAFINDKTLLVNDYRRVARRYGQDLRSILRRHGLELVPFPYCPADDVINGIPSAKGVYMNFLKTHGKIFLPTYGRLDDEHAIRTLERAMPSRRIVPIRCNNLAREGGALHCVTWNLEEG